MLFHVDLPPYGILACFSQQWFFGIHSLLWTVLRSDRDSLMQIAGWVSSPRRCDTAITTSSINGSGICLAGNHERERVITCGTKHQSAFYHSTYLEAKSWSNQPHGCKMWSDTFLLHNLCYHGNVPSHAYEINPYHLESHARTCILILDAQVLSDVSSILTESVRSKLAAASHLTKSSNRAGPRGPSGPTSLRNADTPTAVAVPQPIAKFPRKIREPLLQIREKMLFNGRIFTFTFRRSSETHTFMPRDCAIRMAARVSYRSDEMCIKVCMFGSFSMPLSIKQ